MTSIVHSGRLLKRPTGPCSARACVPRVSARPKRKRDTQKTRKRAPKRTPSGIAKRVKPAPKPKREPVPRKPPLKRKPAPKRTPSGIAKRVKPAPKPAPKRKRVKPAKKRAPSKRSAAAKKGWEKRRKKQRLVEAMHDARWRAESDQPIGWTQRRADIRSINGELWREIAVEYSEDTYQAKYLASLEDLEIDLLTRDELYDYLEWMAQEFDIDISDLYRMYLGYKDKD